MKRIVRGSSDSFPILDPEHPAPSELDARGVVIDDTNLFNDRLQDWDDFCKLQPTHGALGVQTPYERVRQKTTSQV
jgi:hypothetical protein